MSYSRTFAWVGWMIASVFYAYQYILRVMPNIMLTDIMQQFSFDTKTFGQFSGVYYIGYCLMHLPVGILLDRWGPKKIMPICILMTVVGLFPIMFSDYWVYPIIGRVLIGMGSSAAILGAFKIIRMTFQETRFTSMLSLCVTIGLLGAIYGGGPVSYMCTLWGYKAVVGLFAVMGCTLAAITYVMVPAINPQAVSSTTVWSDVKEVFTSPKVMAMCFLAGLMVGPMEGFVDVWGTAYLKLVYGLDMTVASSLPSLIFVGMCFGGPLLSLIAEKTQNYIGTIIAAGVIMGASFTWILSTILDTFTLSVLFVLVGVCCAYQIIAIYKASTYVREGVAGLTTAIANMVIMAFGYVFHSGIGWIIDSFGGVTSATAFQYGLMLIPASLILSVLGYTVFLGKDKKLGEQYV